MANKQKCMIIGAVPLESDKIFEEYPASDYFVICADAGYETALKFGISPDLIVGDYDSATSPPPESMHCLSLPVEKDVTDTMYAATRGLHMGFQFFVLIGCLGGDRFDHSIANIQVLQYIAERSGVAIMATEDTKLVVLQNKRLKITDSVGDTVSVFPLMRCNVTYRGLKYPLHMETLTFTGAIMGVSNSVEDEFAEIIVHSGTALVTIYREQKADTELE